MAFTVYDFKSRQELVDAVREGHQIDMFAPKPYVWPVNGNVDLEGPHYPAPRTWAVTAVIENGKVVEVV